MMKRILVADDEESLRTILKNSLKKKGYEVTCAIDGKEAQKFLKKETFDVVLLDLRMPGCDGFEILDGVKEMENAPAVIVMTAQDTMKNAIEAMKKGAFDYLAKPFDIDELEILVDKALREKDLESEVALLREEVREIHAGPNTIIGQSRLVRDLHKMIGKLAAKDVTVLIQGESGTGKELIARALHFESERAAYPFMPVNMAAIPRELLESELFGHVKGSFTGATDSHAGYFEKAGRGTIFLDEIGEMPLSLQAKVLRVLQERQIQRVGSSDVIPIQARIIAATHQNLQTLVKEKKFREDLYYRLNVVPLEVPPLRMRRDDINLLVDAFVKRFGVELDSPHKKIAPTVMKIFKEYSWPGNIRELENVVKRAIVLSPGATILPEVVLPFLQDDLTPVNVDEIAIEDIIRKKLASFLSKWDGYEMNDVYNTVICRVEKPLIELILEKTRGNQIQTAKILGINRNTLRKKIKELQIEVPSK